MGPLFINRRVLTWLCIYPAEKTATWQWKLLYIIFTAVEIFIFGSAIIAVLALGYKQILFSACNVPAVVGLTYTILSGLRLRHGIVRIFKKLSDICNKYASKDLPEFLTSADKKCEWVWKFYTKYALCGFFINYIFSTFASILVCWLSTGTIIPEFLYRAYIFGVPWDQNTPLGYLAVTFFCIIFAESYLYCSGAFLLLFISLCWYHRAFSKLFRHMTCESAPSPHILKQNLIDIIEFHNTIKNFFSTSLNVYTHFIMIQLICSAVFLAMLAFQLDIKTRNPDAEIIMIFLNSSVGVFNLFIYCYFGKSATDSYAKMTDYLIESKWYEHPNNLQKYFILMIANTQTPVFYHGFNIAVLDLGTFAKMIKATYSYYMMFKTMS